MMKKRPFALSVAVAIALFATLSSASGSDKLVPANEQELIQVLRSGQPADKALACKQLAIYGSKDACPRLAELLSDPQLASWARIALEAIPDQAADEALRNSLDSLQGNLAIGVINSIGVRRDEAAVEKLCKKLRDKNPAIIAAAAVALGRIGNSTATTALRQAILDPRTEVRSAAAEGSLLCADQLLAGGDTAAAVEIYDEVRAAEVPKPRRIEATYGAIVARGHDGLPLLVEQVTTPHRKYFQLALTIIRELPDSDVVPAVAAQLDQVPSDRAALLVHALADRNGLVIPPAIIEATKSADEQVRIAAISLLGRRGDVSHLPTLLAMAADTNPEVANAAKEALALLPGKYIDSAIVTRLANAQGQQLAVLIETVGRRRIDAVPSIVPSLRDSDTEVRKAALSALGKTIGPQDLDVLIAQVISPRNSAEGRIAEQALQTAAVRMADRDGCAAQIAAALSRAPAGTQPSLLKVLGAMGGPTALDAIAKAMQKGDEHIQDAGSRLLGEWMTADAAPVLLEQATASDVGDKYRIRALRGYIRIARQFQMSIEERAEMCGRALATANRVEEQKLVLQALDRYPDLATLRVAIQATKIPAIAEDAKRVALSIAGKLDDKAKAREMLAEVGLDHSTIDVPKVK